MTASHFSRGNLIFSSLLCWFFHWTQLVATFQTTANTRSPWRLSGAAGRPFSTRSMSDDIQSTSKDDRWVELVGRDNFEEWGLERNENARLAVPMTASKVVDESFDAIAGTLYNQQKLDPAIASNSYSRSLFDDRPLRSTGSVGRIGIELDGTHHLFPNIHRICHNRAMRRVALLLAAKMASKSSWCRYEKDVADDYRPIVMCFNTIKEALLASREMQSLQRNYSTYQREAFDHVVIQTISDDLPTILHTKMDKRSRRISKVRVNPVKGLVLVVQPTDFNTDFSPPAPSLHSVTDFQKTVACAYLQQTPVVVLSPRFATGDSSSSNSVNQNSFEKAGYYGGKEPPKGPSPWVLRDFFPPSYCWITSSHCIGSQSQNNSRTSSVSLLTLTNSVMDEYHPWHIYRSTRGSNDRDRPVSMYLASTRSTSGRPTMALLRRIMADCDV